MASHQRHRGVGHFFGAQDFDGVGLGRVKGLRKIGPVELANLVGFSKLPSNERKRAAAEGVKAWIDPEGYGRFIASKRCAFEDEVDLETGVKKVPQK